MSNATSHISFSARTITVSLAAPVPCEHDWTEDAGFVYCHECGVGEPRPAATARTGAGVGGR